MILTRRLFLALSVPAVLAACSPVMPPTTGPGLTPPNLSQGAILAAINDTRKANGRPPLRYNSRLESAARSQAQLMARKD